MYFWKRLDKFSSIFNDLVKKSNGWQDKIQISVPLLHQASNFSCGAACVLAILLYWLPNDELPFENEFKMWEELGTTKEAGTNSQKNCSIIQRTRIGSII